MADPVAVALICGVGDSGRLLREVVAGLGKPIVHDTPAAAFDPVALAASGANVVVVDLTPDAETDSIQDLFNDERYRVIFNEAEVSSRLSGWEHARWARHLAAKILDRPAVLDPPRPDQQALSSASGVQAAAHFVPSPRPASAAADALTERSSGSELGIDDWFSKVLAVEDPTRRFAPNEAVGAPLDERELERPVLTAPTESAPRRDDHALDALMLSAIQSIDTEVAAMHVPPLTGVDFNMDEVLSNIDDWLPPAPIKEPALNAAGLAPDASRLWTPDSATAVDEAADVPPHVPPAELSAAALAEARWAAPDKQAASAAATPNSSAAPVSLQLAGLDDEIMSSPFASRPPSSNAEMRVEQVADPAAISRVIVLCASIGGPEAIRKLLSSLPRDYQALFLVVQQVGNEFQELLTQQLRGSTSLRVRTAEDGGQLGDGDVVPVPLSQRLQVERDGRVRLLSNAEGSSNAPSIGQVLRDVSDRFGSDCAAIILSGVAADAAEACRYLAANGGAVYAQSPASCVSSSMVEQVEQTGVVSFLGTPAELAARLLTDKH